MDRDLFERLVAERAQGWVRDRSTCEFSRSPIRDKSSAWVNCESESGLAQLTVRSSGEADLSSSDKRDREVLVEHYELTSEVGLLGALDDLEDRLRRAP